MKPIEASDSAFLIQIIHKDTGEVVRFAPGLEVEKELEAEFLNRLAAKGIGVARTTAHVVDDARTALRELIYELKSNIHLKGSRL